MVSYKTESEIGLMRQAGRVVGGTLEELKKYIKPGITALELDRIADEYIRSHDCIPTFLGQYGFPGHICISFNEEVVHGIPGRRVLQEGDIIKLDVGATFKGWIADGAATFPVGQVSEKVQKLVDVTREATLRGIEQMRAGNYLYDISAAIHDYVEQNGLNVVTQYVGHGVGRVLHEDPQVPNFRQKNRGMLLKQGLCLAIEPMVNMGTSETRVKPDRWTVVTADGALSAHFEHTSVVTDGAPEILTLP